MVTLEQLQKDAVIVEYVEKANEYLSKIGYTEHGMRHVNLVADIAFNVMDRLGYPRDRAVLASVAGFLHDIGNVCGRDHHEQTGAVLAKQMLERHNMPNKDILDVMFAIGNHEERSGHPVNDITAALILADKTDVHRTRVQTKTKKKEHFDIHDRVNYAVTKSFLNVNSENKEIALELTVDTTVIDVIQYFEIFLDRMIMNKRAAEFLGEKFILKINDVKVL